MLITKSVIMKWNPNNKKWYENKGYEFTKYGNEFKINVEHLSKYSRSLVNIECDDCGKILKDTIWQDYIRCVHEDGKYYCHKCASRLFSVEKVRKTKLKSSKSFEQWCYDNLPKEDANKILSRWDYDLNKQSPKDISYGSEGNNRKGYWLKCIEHPEHVSEQKRISNFTNEGRKGNGDITCNQCNMIAITYPYLIKYLVDKEDAYKYSHGSNTKIPMKCPDCGFEKEMEFYTLIQGFGCSKCGDGFSYSEKFMFNILEQLNILFKTQLSKSTFEWCNNYKYDFYINKINCIIETHGIQHYEETTGNWKNSLITIQENDKYKEQLAKENGIDKNHYIIINCRKSEMEWIKNSILQSNLPTLLNFKEEDINWLKCHEWACNSLVKKVCDLWNSEVSNVTRISEILKMNSNTIRKYLKQGVEIGWCNYDPKEELIKRNININNKDKRIKIICTTTNEIFNSINDATKKYKIANTNISKCCKGNLNLAGKHPETRQKLIWMYYEDFIKISIINKI